ncbi:MAG: transglycosylase SLT domain-containing protein, partial [Candidatus Dormibacteria bacterium]
YEMSNQVKSIQDLKTTNLTLEQQAMQKQLNFSNSIVTSPEEKVMSTFYINKYFGGLASEAVKVFTCESNLNNTAINRRNTNGTLDMGIAQINSVHQAQFKTITGLDYNIGALDPDANIKFAYWLYQHSGWTAWACYGIVEKK